MNEEQEFEYYESLFTEHTNEANLLARLNKVRLAASFGLKAIKAHKDGSVPLRNSTALFIVKHVTGFEQQIKAIASELSLYYADISSKGQE